VTRAAAYFRRCLAPGVAAIPRSARIAGLVLILLWIVVFAGRFIGFRIPF
jgi:hypothetical protein